MYTSRNFYGPQERGLGRSCSRSHRGCEVLLTPCYPSSLQSSDTMHLQLEVPGNGSPRKPIAPDPSLLPVCFLEPLQPVSPVQVPSPPLRCERSASLPGIGLSPHFFGPPTSISMDWRILKFISPILYISSCI